MHGNIVLVGVGGTGMSGLTSFLHTLGFSNIIGIDSTASQMTDNLQKKGIQVIIGHGKYEVTEYDQVIYSAAAKESPEVHQAKETAFATKKRAHPPLLFHQFLGELSKLFSTIAVTGSHGKSTTTAMTGTACRECDPKFGFAIVAAPVTQRSGEQFVIKPVHQETITALIRSRFDPKAPRQESLVKSLHFVVECDEYNKHFLRYDVDYALITNIELDHIDIYGSEENYVHTFHQFVAKVRKQTYIVAGALGAQHLEDTSKVTFIPLHDFSFSKIVGGHNAMNASLPYTLLQDITSTPVEKIEKSLSTFAGLRRRCELLGTTRQGVLFYSDYGHHPSEVASTLSALQHQFPGTPLHVIFQPHQLQRTLTFRNEFVESLSSAETVSIYEIYAARENIEELLAGSHLANLSSVDAVGKQLAKESGGVYMNSFEKIEEYVSSITDGIIVLFTAGSLDYKIRNSENLFIS